MKAQWIIVFFQLAATLSFSAQDSQWINTSGSSGDFPLAHQQRAATLVYDPVDAAVVGIAVRDLAADIERVTGFRPAVETNLSNLSDTVVFVGTLGGSSTIDRLAREGKFDAGPLRGQWESFIIATVTNPLPGVARGLILAGSDRRGTAFAVYELSQAIGVSPWHWWADVPPVRRDALYVPAGTRRFGPPSVKYRGIFLNDEDWALQPWAAKTFEPEVGDIGPKTYARIFELLLRLKANTLWPAMHACTKPFNHYPENKRVADNYGIVMGSSHAEPMLRNNVGEWTNEARAFNYVANREGVLNYWEQRVRENGKFENIYTLGMRGIHDSGMQGPRGRNEQIRVLEQIFSDQRDLLARHVRPDVETIPQMFCAYKEVLALYRGGLKVPDDVTIMFPDDNFGYIRDFPGVEERRRKGGFGVYYHLSYLGRPLAYLWLYTTPPALVWEEMSKAYDQWRAHDLDRECGGSQARGDRHRVLSTNGVEHRTLAARQSSGVSRSVGRARVRRRPGSVDCVRHGSLLPAELSTQTRASPVVAAQRGTAFQPADPTRSGREIERLCKAPLRRATHRTHFEQ